MCQLLLAVVFATLFASVLGVEQDEPIAKIDKCLEDANTLITTCFAQYERLNQLLGDDKTKPNCCAYAQLGHCIKNHAANANCDDKGHELLHKHDLLHFAADYCEDVSITSVECLVVLNMVSSIIIGIAVAVTLVCAATVCCYKCIEMGCRCANRNRPNGVYIVGRRGVAGGESMTNLMMESDFNCDYNREPVTYFPPPAPRYQV